MFDKFGIFKEIVEKTATEIYSQQGFLSSLIMFVNKSGSASMVNLDRFNKELFDESIKPEDIKMFALIIDEADENKNIVGIFIKDNGENYYTAAYSKVEEEDRKYLVKKSKKLSDDNIKEFDYILGGGDNGKK